MIDGQQQWRRPQRADVRHQCRQLLRVFIIASEKNDAAHQWMAQQFAIFGGQRLAGDVHHQRTQCHSLKLLRGIEYGDGLYMAGMRKHIDDTGRGQEKPCSDTSIPKSRARLPGWQDT